MYIRQCNFETLLFYYFCEGTHMNKVLLKNARVICTCDQSDQILLDADILIAGPAIIDMGKDLADADAQVIDASGKLIYPGLINTHHHFFQTFIRNQMSVDYPNMHVVEWLDKIYKVFKEVDEEVVYYSSLVAMADLIKHGCTCAFDHQYCYTQKTGKVSVDRQMEAAKLLGIRYHAGRGTNTLPRDKGSTMPDEMLETTDEFLADCSRLAQKYHDPSPFSMSQIVVSPCQPMNSYKETFIDSVTFARANNLRLHTHLGEGEDNIMLERYGKRTLDWCEEIGFSGPDVWYAHGWDLTKEEYMRVGKAGTGISHCPAPAVMGGFPILPIKDMLEHNVLVSLGCDGSATNDSSNLLDSLRVSYLMQAYHSKARGGCPSPYDMLKIATVNGAKTLGREKLGSLQIGHAADLFLIDTDVLEYVGTLHDPKNLLARVGVTGPVWMTMINGKIVYKDGRLQNADEETLAKEGNALYKKVIAQALLAQ